MKKNLLETYFLWYECFSSVLSDKGGAEKKPEPKINNFGSATLLSYT